MIWRGILSMVSPAVCVGTDATALIICLRCNRPPKRWRIANPNTWSLEISTVNDVRHRYGTSRFRYAVLTFINKTSNDWCIVRIVGSCDAILICHAVVQIEHVLRWIPRSILHIIKHRNAENLVVGFTGTKVKKRSKYEMKLRKSSCIIAGELATV